MASIKKFANEASDTIAKVLRLIAGLPDAKRKKVESELRQHLLKTDNPYVVVRREHYHEFLAVLNLYVTKTHRGTLRRGECKRDRNKFTLQAVQTKLFNPADPDYEALRDFIVNELGYVPNGRNGKPMSGKEIWKQFRRSKEAMSLLQ
jgi:hypothetical protein